jgi:hypothetical protein
MSFIKHIGKHGDRKVAILYREVPNEPHMCLVTYTELLNRHVHDPMMQCIESAIGQTSTNLADALNRVHTNDGKYILQVLHREGLIKKVQTEQIVMTPNSQTKIKLSELNKILDEMEQGEAAVRKLAELDASLGMQTPQEIAKRMRDNAEPANTPPKGIAGGQDILGDTVLANNLRSQASRMEAEAKGLLAESQRLQQEANDLMGIPTTTQTTEPVKRGRGRPAKVKTLV